MDGSVKQEVALDWEANTYFLRWRVTILLTSSIISSFLGPSVVWRVWFRKSHKYQKTFHIY